MNPRAAALLLVTIVAAPSVPYFRYQRPVLNPPPQAQQTCVTLDPAIFLHADPDLASLRLYNRETETPYAINDATLIQPFTKNITPLNIGLRNGTTSFDAAMPEGPYSDLDLAVDAHDFIATIRVTGSQTQSGPTTTPGAYTIFDFTRQKLGRSTVLHLPPSDFRYLHFRIEGPIRPDQITGLTTERLSASQPQYITVATATTIQQQNRDTLIKFTIPANIPVDRILFAPGAQPVNFSRQVSITVEPAMRPSTDAEREPLPLYSSGDLLRIHSMQNGRKIDEERLSLDPPAYASSFAAPSGTNWTIAIHNQDDTPLTLQSVSLQMLARTLCFNAEPGAAYKLYYGDKALAAPHYDYATLFALDKNAARASLGPEQPNPQYQPRPDTRPFTEKHPALLWIVLIAAIFLLGVIALRSGKQLKQPPS